SKRVRLPPLKLRETKSLPRDEFSAGPENFLPVPRKNGRVWRRVFLGKCCELLEILLYILQTVDDLKSSSCSWNLFVLMISAKQVMGGRLIEIRYKQPD